MHDPEQILEATLCAELEHAIARSRGAPCRIRRSACISGGSIAQAVVLRTDSAPCFVKLASADRHALLVAEADGLAALAACPALRVPQVIALGCSGRHAYLLLEHLDLHPLGQGTATVVVDNAARALAALHRIVGARFGWQHDNFIGSTPQCNAQHDAWPDFFARRRLLPQLELAKRLRATHSLIAAGERLADRLPAFFAGYAPAISLVHGDLWHGNAALSESGQLALYDPAVHYGDRETDLAMCDLFGGFPDRFYSAYRDASPLAPGWQSRKTLYQLYHVLNHLNLFGNAYLKQAETMVDRLLAETA